MDSKKTRKQNRCWWMLLYPKFPGKRATPAITEAAVKRKVTENLTHFMYLDGKLLGLSFATYFSKCIRENPVLN
jgi:hypothetical protein